MEANDYDAMKMTIWLPTQYLSHIASIAVLLVILHAVKKFMKKRRLRFPPAPPGWPIIGHLHLIRKMSHHSFMELAKKYGPLMTIRLGGIHTVVVSSSAMAKNVLKTQDHVFGSRCQHTALGELFGYSNSDVVMGAMGERWRFLRKICAQELFSLKRIELSTETRRREMLSTVERILEAGQEGDAVQLDMKLRELGCNIITQELFNRSFYNQRNTNAKASLEAEDFSQMSRDFSKLVGFILSECFPFLRRFDLDGSEAKMRSLFFRYDTFLNNLIEEHRQQAASQSTTAKDFVDVLLELQKENNRLLTDESIKGVLMDMLIAGVDTSMSTVVWALAELMRHPETCQKAQHELDLIVGRDRMVQESDIVHLQYLQAVLKETFRLHPVVPLLVPHESLSATNVGGYDFPEKTRVIINVYALGRDPNVWKNPLDFDPERFVDSPMDVKGQDFDLLPFGSGRRMCAGINLALVIVSMTTAQILHTCEFSLPQGMKPLDIDVEEMFGESAPKLNPLKLHVRPRLPLHVYREAGLDL
ncbi:hypothetical protein Mapa_001574 [Marchantia paleacea]|nr:hypothetical protein Mapa_001574 [Marchantia paleacea]